MNDFAIEFHAESLVDSENAYIRYELQQKGLGERFLQNLRQKLDIIANSPELFGVKTLPTHTFGKNYKFTPLRIKMK